MIETHPYEPFVPKDTKILILGSFPSKFPAQNPKFNFYYTNGRNHFWPILEIVYGVTLDDINKKKDLLERLGIALSDVIYQCERKSGSSLDSSLYNFIYNFENINKVLIDNHIEKIIFTSRFVEKVFKKYFKEIIAKYPNIELITLPSPSPRYAILTKQQKADIYKNILPSV